MIFGFEIDGIISSPVRNKMAMTDVEKCQVLPEAKENLIKLKELGHQIVIYTQRDVSLGQVTETWLQRNKIPYDYIILSKPEVDIMVDQNCHKFKSWEDLMESYKYRIMSV